MIERVAWADHLARLDWRQGEHVALVGPTGCGKTTAMLDLIERRGWVTLLATKPRDRTLRRLPGWTRIEQWPPPPMTNRVMLWPRWRTIADNAKQGAEFREGISRMVMAGSWCIVADDAEHLTQNLGMEPMLRTMLNQARAMDVSIVTASQRPRRVPVAVWSNSSHFYVWATPHPDDRKALSGIAGLDYRQLGEVLRALPSRHDLLYVNPTTGEVTITNTRG